MPWSLSLSPLLKSKFYFFSMNIICKHDNVLIVYFHKDNVALIFIPCKKWHLPLTFHMNELWPSILLIAIHLWHETCAFISAISRIFNRCQFSLSWYICIFVSLYTPIMNHFIESCRCDLYTSFLLYIIISHWPVT